MQIGTCDNKCRALEGGNEKWRALGNTSQFDDDEILLRSYMRSKNKKKWRPGRTGNPFHAQIAFRSTSKSIKFGSMTTRKIANKLGISRQAAWMRIRSTMKSWGVSWNAAAALVLAGFSNQSRGKVKITPGMRFGKLTTIKVLSYEDRPQHVSVKHLKEHYWKCRCDCGAIKAVSANHLRSGHTSSCGCVRKQQLSARAKTAKICTIDGMTINEYVKQHKTHTWHWFAVRCHNASVQTGLTEFTSEHVAEWEKENDKVQD